MGLGAILKERAQTLLLEASRPLSRQEIQAHLGTAPTNIYNLLRYLKDRNGNNFVKSKEGYSLLTDGRNQYQKFVLPEALLRGWVDPTTGIVPTHLGL